MHTWHWQTWEGMPYLTCSLLDSWQHGFFTQQFAPRTPVDLVEVLHPHAGVYRTKQVHGNVVPLTSELEPLSGADSPAPELYFADGIVSDRSEASVWVCSADCTPVLIADDRTGQVAAVHSGWRGTAAGIVGEAIARLQAGGSNVADLRVAMGPAISGEMYQVTREVGAKVVAAFADCEGEAEIEVQLDRLMAFPDSPVLKDSEPGRIRLDIRKAIARQLDRLGVDLDCVSIAPHCTYQEPEYFFSYRRTAEKNVQWSGIVSRELGE
ncbi:MAG: peptidoglycan editing factor PgeF [Cyanobacteriota bacterium]|nr:peptidoglycan editing factor PgeF [Cyanobacteriota bacterium]